MTGREKEVGTIRVDWRRVRWAAAVCYLGVFVASVAYDGVPLFRVSVIVWTLGALAVYCLGRRWAMFGRALVDWLPFMAVMMCYDLTRGAADRLGQPIHVSWPANVDRWLFDGTLPTGWLQDHLYRPGVIHWYDIAASLVYFSFFVVVPVVMAVLWIVDRRLWRRFTVSVVLLSFAGAVTFVLFPQAPPWYAAQRGVIPPVARISSLGWNDIGLHTASDLIQQGQLLANDVAAMPSLHEAYTVLVVAFFLRRAPRWSRPLLLTYPLAMGLTLVYTGEHYVIDLVMGACYAVAVHATVSVVADAWTTGRARRTVGHAGRPPGTSRPPGHLRPSMGVDHGGSREGLPCDDPVPRCDAAAAETPSSAACYVGEAQEASAIRLIAPSVRGIPS